MRQSKERMYIVQETCKWLAVPDLALRSECPTRWNSFLLCMKRMTKIKEALNATFVEAEKPDLLLTQDETNLMDALIKELEPFETITNMVCTNKTFSFNHYLPMKDIILDLLNQDVDLTQTSSPIVKFRELLLEHFQRFELTEETSRLAKTASLVDPTHMIKAPEEDLPELIDHVVQILQQDVPAAADPETQEVGPSQALVSTSVNVPKPRGSKPKSAMALYLNPSFGVAKNKSKPGPVKQHIVRTPIKELVMREVWAFYENVHANQHDIMTKVDNGTFDLSEWWAEHHKEFPKLAIVVKNLLCIPATSASCERAFSTLTDVVNKKRNRLHSETTRKLTFLKHNLNLIPEYTRNPQEIPPATETPATEDENEETSDLDDWD